LVDGTRQILNGVSQSGSNLASKTSKDNLIIGGSTGIISSRL